MSTGDKGIRAYWEERKADNRAVEAAEVVEVRRVSSRYQVVAPYRAGFPKAARAMGARWRPRSRCWSFPAGSGVALVELIARFHGAEKVPGWMRPQP